MTWRPLDLGMLALQRRNFPAAREHLESAGPDDRALLLRGELAEHGHGGPAARDLYEHAARLGNAEAAFRLGALHATGRGGSRDDAAALDWYRRAAEAGHAAAHRESGVLHAAGRGVPVDDVAAEYDWRLAAEAGNRDAMHDLGVLFAHRRDDPVEATSWFLRAAAAGDERADAELVRLAPALVEPSAHDRTARTLLGVVHAFHLGDPVRGAELLTTSSAEGDPVATRTLGYLVQHGLGTPADADRAVALYRAAAEAGDALAAYNVGMLHGASPAAVPWLLQAADAGIVPAYAPLGDRLGEQDRDEEALRWFVRGASAGDPGCMFAAACWYRDGFGGPVDRVQALRWYLAMLDAGNGNGIHEAHGLVPHMSVDEIHEAGRLSGRLLEADLFARQQ
ncbi:tetratricopeptide repeat protein [Cryptosporangium aurantiacum]|nr:tetratricopeptide repeat protein [Cryptosporangium aurantiacum]